MKNNLIVCGIAVAIVLGFIGIFTPVGRSAIQTLGAVATLDNVDSSYSSIGGMKEYRVTVPFTATSSVIGSIRNPWNATSTIDFISMNGNSLIGTNPIYISTSTTGYGSSTPALVAALAMTSNSKFSFVWVKNTATTTAAAATGNSTGNPDVLPGVQWRGTGSNANNAGIGSSNYILGPAEYLNFAIATSTAGTFGTYMTGSGITVLLRKI